jgi:hypothetical protein
VSAPSIAKGRVDELVKGAGHVGVVPLDEPLLEELLLVDAPLELPLEEVPLDDVDPLLEELLLVDAPLEVPLDELAPPLDAEVLLHGTPLEPELVLLEPELLPDPPSARSTQTSLTHVSPELQVPFP